MFAACLCHIFLYVGEKEDLDSQVKGWVPVLCQAGMEAYLIFVANSF